MAANTLKLIKDPIRGNIVFSALEAEVFSLPLFNRLHHIQQNSLAYFVYPAMRTSRFVHSLGVMDIAAHLFRNGLINATAKDVRAFAKSMHSRIEKVVNTKAFLDHLLVEERKFLDESKWKLSEAVLTQLAGSAFLRVFSFNRDDAELDDDFRADYILLLQMVRMAALLHDLGHLPGSHLGERAIGMFLDKAKGNCDKGKGSKLEKEILLDFKKHIEENTKFHEIVGRRVSKFLLDDLLESSTRNAKLAEKAQHKFHLLVLWQMVAECKERGEFSVPHQIISATIDADRLDFVPRDGRCSGLLGDSGDVDRVIKQYVLRGQNGRKDFAFLPALQSISDIQEVLLDRFRVYKFIVNHHKVRRMDYCLQRAIEVLLHIELAEASKRVEPSELYGKRKKVDTTVDSALDILAAVVSDDELFTYRFTQLTDDWLQGILKRRYNEFMWIKEKGEPLGENQEMFLALLAQVFTFSKEYRSAWKRDHEYRSLLARSFSRRKVRAKKWIDECIRLKRFPQHRETRLLPALRALEAKDYFTAGQHLVDLLLTQKGKPLGFRHLEKRLCVLTGKTVSVAPADLGSGIEPGFALADLKNPDALCPFEEVCSLTDFLRKEEFRGARFFIYVASDSEDIPSILEENLALAIVEILKHFTE